MTASRPVIAKFHKADNYDWKEIHTTDFLQLIKDAKKFLASDNRGCVEVVYAENNLPVTSFFLDFFTKKFMPSDTPKFIIAHNDCYPYSFANNITEARIKACEIMDKERSSNMTIYAVTKSAYNKMNLIGVIITNGYRYEYSDVVKKKGYTLNPKTGRLSSY